MIETRNIHKHYGDLHVLKGINLSIKQAEIVSIVGASGAGKSTFLQILGTIDKADQGEIFFNNKNITNLSKNELAKFRNTNIGFIFQFHHLLNEFDALENVCLPGFIANKNTKSIKNRAEELLVKLGLKDRLLHKPNELSGGEQQRVSVARALINKPLIILADEPSGNLDSKNAEELHDIFINLRDEFKQTFVIVTHNEQLANISDRKIIMKDGLII
jgi:lipoprotein-releasing system ATP-binding protein